MLKRNSVSGKIKEKKRKDGRQMKKRKATSTVKKGVIFVHIGCVIIKCIGLYLFTFVFNFTVSVLLSILKAAY